MLESGPWLCWTNKEVGGAPKSGTPKSGSPPGGFLFIVDDVDVMTLIISSPHVDIYVVLTNYF